MNQEEFKAKHDEITARIESLVNQLAGLRAEDPDIPPPLFGEAAPPSPRFIVGWAVAYEWTSVELERSDRFGISTVTPPQQSGSLSRGLLMNGAEQFDPSNYPPRY